jgi:tRNA(Ile)-lysidine synthase
MILGPLLHPVERAVAQTKLVPRNDTVVVAVSGGADSMALVEELRGWNTKLIVAHFDHKLRDDSARDAHHVEAYARECGLEFALGAWRRRPRGASIEEAARDARYGFLASVAEGYGAACIVTAHTRTDQIETILMRILRGSGRAGVAGIPERRGWVVRPLLGVTRAETRDYCESRGVAYIDDPSNDDVRFFRNRIRHEILPELRAVFPSIDDTLLRLADHARHEQREFAVGTVAWLEDSLTIESPGVWTLRLDGFQGFDDEDATALLHDALAHAGLARDVGRVHYARLLELVRQDHAGSSTDLPGLNVRREHDALVIKRVARGWRPAGAHKGEPPSAEARMASPQWAAGRQDPRALLAIPGFTQIEDWTIEAEFVDRNEARRALASPEAGEHVAYFDADSIGAALFARLTQPGDRMRPFGLGGRKKLSDLFIDRKIPWRARKRAIVIEGDSIYWVPGVARSDFGPIGDATERVVRLKSRLL